MATLDIAQVDGSVIEEAAALVRSEDRLVSRGLRAQAQHYRDLFATLAANHGVSEEDLRIATVHAIALTEVGGK